jgi:hypothetical protein
MWQVIDEVATPELGGAPSRSRYRTLATCGAVITAWLGNNVSRIMQPSGPIIDIRESLNSPPPSRYKPCTDPQTTISSKPASCGSGIPRRATSVSKGWRNRARSPVMPSNPIPIPSVAKDMLGDLDLPAFE